MSDEKALEELQAWYHAQCDEDWEHTYGVEIGTLDNPGWFLKVDLTDTILFGKEFSEVNYGNDDDESPEWVATKIEDHKFVGYGGPRKLGELIQIFLNWAKTEKDWLAVPPPPTKEELDQVWYNSLDENTGPEKCKNDKCSSLKMKGSVFCRDHHFQ